MAGVSISHPARVIDHASGATKLDLARYYAAIASLMLPELRGRPVGLVRAPRGIDEATFYQRHAENLDIPHVTRLDRRLYPGHAALIAVDSLEALVGAVQMGAVEFHTWGARTPDLLHPDRLVIDVDPDPALPWNRVIDAAERVLALLDELQLTAYIKTSGGHGLHLLVPIRAELDWDEARGVAKSIAEYLTRVYPQQFSATSGSRHRVGKVFVDYLRNSWGASTVAAYSARARPGLPVSVPVLREELSGLKAPNSWTIRNLAERLEALGGKNPLDGIESHDQRITRAVRRQLAQMSS